MEFLKRCINCGSPEDDIDTYSYLLEPKFVYHRFEQAQTRGELWGMPYADGSINDGTLKSNIRRNLLEDHSVFGIFFANPLHPFSKWERGIYLFSSLCFLLLIQALFYSADVEIDSYVEGFVITLLVYPYKRILHFILVCPCFHDREYKHVNDENTLIESGMTAVEGFGRILASGNMCLAMFFLLVAILIIMNANDGSAFALEWLFSQGLAFFVTEVAFIVILTVVASLPTLPILGESQRVRFQKKWKLASPNPGKYSGGNVEQQADGFYWSEEGDLPGLPVSYAHVAALAWNHAKHKRGHVQFLCSTDGHIDDNYMKLFGISPTLNMEFEKKVTEALTYINNGKVLCAAEDGTAGPMKGGIVPVDEPRCTEKAAPPSPTRKQVAPMPGWHKSSSHKSSSHKSSSHKSSSHKSSKHHSKQ